MQQMAISIPRQVGLYVRRAREARGITRAQLARTAQVSERLLASLELGDAPGIQLDKLLAVCHALDLELCLHAARKASNDAPTGKPTRNHQAEPKEPTGAIPRANIECQEAPNPGYDSAWDEFMLAQGIQAPSPLSASSRAEG